MLNVSVIVVFLSNERTVGMKTNEMEVTSVLVREVTMVSIALLRGDGPGCL